MQYLLSGEGIGGALHWRTLYNIAEEVGFAAPRLVEASEFHLKDDAWKDVVGECRNTAGHDNQANCVPFC
jgi:hypothetical protein